MNPLRAVVYGIVQGLTEFLPVSSTAHLRIVAAIAGWPDPGAAFTAVVQLGTLGAVLTYFRRDLLRIATAMVRSLRRRSLAGDDDARLGWGIAIGTVPIVVVGFLLRSVIEGPARNLWVIAAGLGLFSLVMEIADRRGTGQRELTSAGWRDGLAIGGAQVAALIPGVSRSGATISMGLHRRFGRAAAARYSFLLSIPAVVLSALFELRKVADPGGASLVATGIATAAAFAIGYGTIAGLLHIIAKGSLRVFTVYRVGLAAALVVLLATGALSAS